MSDDQDLMQDEAFEERIAGLQKKSKLLMAMLIVSLVVALGSGGFAFVSVSSLKKELSSAKDVVEKIDAGDQPEVEAPGAVQDVGIIHPLGSFVVNLLDPGNLRYVNCRIELEVDDSSVVKQITRREAQFKDAVISLVGNKSYEDLMGIEGKTRIREELMVRFNRLLPEGQIARVYLTEFVVQ